MMASGIGNFAWPSSPAAEPECSARKVIHGEPVVQGIEDGDGLAAMRPSLTSTCAVAARSSVRSLTNHARFALAPLGGSASSHGAGGRLHRLR